MRVAKALIFDNRGHALVLRRSATHPTYAHEADLPGGIIENGESYEDGLAREIREETGLIVVPDQLHYLAQKNKLGPQTRRLYTARLTERPPVAVSWEHDTYEWVAPDKLAAALVSRDSYMAFVLRTVLKHKQ